MIISRNLLLGVVMVIVLAINVGMTILFLVPPRAPAHTDATRVLTQPYSAAEAVSLPKVVEPLQPKVGHGRLTPITLRPEDLGKPLMRAPYVLAVEVRIIGQAPFLGNLNRSVRKFLEGNPKYREHYSEILDDTRLCNPRVITTDQINICVKNEVGNKDSS